MVNYFILLISHTYVALIQNVNEHIFMFRLTYTYFLNITRLNPAIISQHTFQSKHFCQELYRIQFEQQMNI